MAPSGESAAASGPPATAMVIELIDGMTMEELRVLPANALRGVIDSSWELLSKTDVYNSLKVGTLRTPEDVKQWCEEQMDKYGKDMTRKETLDVFQEVVQISNRVFTFEEEHTPNADKLALLKELLDLKVDKTNAARLRQFAIMDKLRLGAKRGFWVFPTAREQGYLDRGQVEGWEHHIETKGDQMLGQGKPVQGTAGDPEFHPRAYPGLTKAEWVIFEQRRKDYINYNPKLFEEKRRENLTSEVCLPVINAKLAREDKARGQLREKVGKLYNQSTGLWANQKKLLDEMRSAKADGMKVFAENKDDSVRSISGHRMNAMFPGSRRGWNTPSDSLPGGGKSIADMDVGKYLSALDNRLSLAAGDADGKGVESSPGPRVDEMAWNAALRAANTDPAVMRNFTNDHNTADGKKPLQRHARYNLAAAPARSTAAVVSVRSIQREGGGEGGGGSTRRMKQTKLTSGHAPGVKDTCGSPLAKKNGLNPAAMNQTLKAGNLGTGVGKRVSKLEHEPAEVVMVGRDTALPADPQKFNEAVRKKEFQVEKEDKEAERLARLAEIARLKALAAAAKRAKRAALLQGDEERRRQIWQTKMMFREDLYAKDLAKLREQLERERLAREAEERERRRLAELQRRELEELLANCLICTQCGERFCKEGGSGNDRVQEILTHLRASQSKVLEDLKIDTDRDFMGCRHHPGYFFDSKMASVGGAGKVDKVVGAWTCCLSSASDAAGCKHGRHTDEQLVHQGKKMNPMRERVMMARQFTEQQAKTSRPPTNRRARRGSMAERAGNSKTDDAKAVEQAADLNKMRSHQKGRR